MFDCLHPLIQSAFLREVKSAFSLFSHRFSVFIQLNLRLSHFDVMEFKSTHKNMTLLVFISFARSARSLHWNHPEWRIQHLLCWDGSDFISLSCLQFVVKFGKNIPTKRLNDVEVELCISEFRIVVLTSCSFVLPFSYSVNCLKIRALVLAALDAIDTKVVLCCVQQIKDFALNLL